MGLNKLVLSFSYCGYVTEARQNSRAQAGECSHGDRSCQSDDMMLCIFNVKVRDFLLRYLTEVCSPLLGKMHMVVLCA